MSQAAPSSNDALRSLPMRPACRWVCARRFGVRGTVMSGALNAESHGPLQRLLAARVASKRLFQQCGNDWCLSSGVRQKRTRAGG
jgi:hypothetical protein